MNEQLIKLIDLCLADGVISDKEREVIFRKAKSLGVDEDECEIILEGMIQKVKNVPIVTNLTPAKPKRNFTLKEVKSIKPAPLDKEKELSKKVAVLKEKEKNISSDFNLVLEDLQASNDEIKTIKTPLEEEFKKFEKSFIKTKRTTVTKYIDNVNQEISKKYGKTHIILTEKEKSKISNYNLEQLNNYIIKESKWSTERYERKVVIFGTAFYLLLVITIVWFFIIVSGSSDFDDIPTIFWILIGICMVTFNRFEYFKNRKDMNFTEDDVKKVLNSISKSFKDIFKQLESKEKIINYYSALSKYMMPNYKKKYIMNKELNEIL